MTYLTVIGAEEVTTKRLKTAFQNAFFNVWQDDNDENEFVVEIDNQKIEIILDPQRKTLIIKKVNCAGIKADVLDQIEAQIYQKCHDISSHYSLCNFGCVIMDDRNALFFVNTHEVRFNHGLNIAQFIDDVRFFKVTNRAAVIDMAEFLKAQKAFLDD